MLSSCQPRLGKVRLRMLNRPLNAVLVRLAIVAVALAALLLIAPAATAQEADADPPPPCNAAGTECDYDENDTVPIATYSSADPEGQGIEWSVGGTDACGLRHHGRRADLQEVSQLRGSRPTGMRDEVRDPDDNSDVIVTADAAGNNVYLVTVTATEMLTEGQEPPAEVQFARRPGDGQGRGRSPGS